MVPQTRRNAAIAWVPYPLADDGVGALQGPSPMSVTSNILMSALFVGLSLPAFAQGPTTTTTTTTSAKPVAAQPAAVAKPNAAKTTVVKPAGTTAPVVKTN
jgi:hypothetical protein